ncbi:SPOR domain-containing protein [Erythrobacter sp. JK5]|uniref:SPOR domain-containing protein n=1 Tax=Erythrobacter sp. JK5 TaxID=2829500 RepID=UPI001BA9B77A|nr:SPOR domain-containing protein [Erythrobacter sp. JK5]QUL36587.1 SPOR domain-containing protein [Erythrobacter sp. JK5]
MIEAEFEEIEDGPEELDLSGEDSLPWLESDEDEDEGGYDAAQIIGFAAILIALLAGIVGGVWYFTNRSGDASLVADGSTIEAPAGPYKERPQDPGGKQFAGTGNVAPVVGEGQTREGVMAERGGDAGSGETGEDTARPTIATRTTAETAATATAGNTPSSVVGVQVGAYGSRARAEEGWATLTRSSDALSGVRYRIVKGEADIGTVYRLQALAADRAAADRLCDALKADGLPCQVKP